MTSDLSPTPGTTIALEGPFVSEGGSAWRCAVPEALAGVVGNDLARPFRSRLQLLENGEPIAGDRHAQLTEISAHGAGRYNHWHGTLYFSAGDSGDPNRAGRTYALRVLEPAPRLAAFGSCHANMVAAAMAARGWIETVPHYGLSYNTLDTRQLIARVRGDLSAPEALAPFISLGDRLGDPSFFDDVGGMLLEISSRTVITCEGQSLLPCAVRQAIVDPAVERGGDEAEAARRWMRFGLIRHDEAVRAEAAARLLAYMERAMPADDPRLAVVRGARARPETDAEVAEGMEALVGTFDCPAVLLLHIQRYMPDGRPLRWPSGFHGRLKEIAAHLNVPVVDPAALVECVGAEVALVDDLRHYRPAFIDDLAAMTFSKLPIGVP